MIMAELSDNVKQFWQRLSESEEYHSKLEATTEEGDILALAKEMGIDISLEELQAGMDELTHLSTEEGQLSDEQLEAVAGGGARTSAFKILVKSIWTYARASSW